MISPEGILAFLFSHPGVFPESAWLVTLAMLAVLGFSAAVDAWTGKVPGVWLSIAFAVGLYVSVVYEGQSEAIIRTVIALIAVLALWLFNETYYYFFHRDAYGLGDVKWSGLATFLYGLKTVFWTWCLGAGLGLVWMLVFYLLGLVSYRFKSLRYVHFVPFLFIALLAVLQFTSKSF